MKHGYVKTSLSPRCRVFSTDCERGWSREAGIPFRNSRKRTPPSLNASRRHAFYRLFLIRSFLAPEGRADRRKRKRVREREGKRNAPEWREARIVPLLATRCTVYNGNATAGGFISLAAFSTLLRGRLLITIQRARHTRARARPRARF